MKILARSIAVLAVALVAAPGALAQSYEETAAPAYSSTQPAFSSAELDQMLAPVALYPDELLSQVLMASTYPLEVVQAARWSRSNPNLQGDDAVSAVVSMDWDPSVKSLVAFPDVLEQMDQNLDWTQRLGEAFLSDQDGVMASVQRLRGAAMDAGNLATTDELVVTHEGDSIALDSPSPDMMYVPYYDPNVVYGSWWWPSYPPVYWSPWPGYYWGSYGFAWTVGIPIGVDFFYGDFDWHRHHVRVYDHHPFYVHDHDYDRDRDHRWRYDPHHRRDVQFRNPVARQEFAHVTSPRLPRTSDRTPRTGGHAPRPAQPATQQGTSSAIARPNATLSVPQGSSSPIARPNVTQSVPQGASSPIARPNATQPVPHAAPVQPRTAPQQGFFPQQAAPQAAHPPAAQQQIRRQPQYGQPQQPIQRQPQYAQPQHVGPQYGQPQPLARPSPAPTGVHAMPQFQHPAPQPAPQVRVAPQVHAPQQPAARPSAPPAAHPAPADGHGDAKGGGDASRGAGR